MFAFRLPIYLYRLKLGWSLGHRFLLLIHRGRKSGLLHQTVLEVIRYNPAAEESVVLSARGEKAEEQFTILVSDINDAPTDIELSSSSVDENQPSGTTVGTLSSADQDTTDSHTYTLVSGAGDEDNGSFQISGDTLQTNEAFDFEAKDSYTIRVKTDDGNGGTFEKQLTVTVTNANDAPTDIALSRSDIDENKPSGTAVGTFSRSLV